MNHLEQLGGGHRFGGLRFGLLGRLLERLPAIFFFPMCILYITYGVAKSMVMGLIDRLPDHDPMDDDEYGDEVAVYDFASSNTFINDVVVTKGGGLFAFRPD